ncbi:GNAT family N-acetyltransferase [Nocardioides sp.]|uniref:GNAT family N-acetyltransferase n=1 Tax=Nocardioides sp. TaxID=35761 RepID=UPI002F422DB1
MTDVSELVIRPLDPHDDADMNGFQDVYAASELAEDPDAALYSREDGIAMLTSGDTTSLFDAFGAFLGDRMVAETVLMGSMRDNLELGQVLLWVDPDHRSRGFGTRALDHVEEHARNRGRWNLRVQVRIGEGLAGNRLFAERHGYTLAMTEIERRLALPVDLDHVDRLAAGAAPHHDGYQIRSFVGPVPEGLRASYVEIRNLLGIEAPHGDLELEIGRDTVEDLDVLEREGAQAGRTSLTAVALHDTAVVAYAHASVPAAGFHHVDQYGTLVHPDHRGHRLGMAVKCAQLRLLAELFPDRDYIQTSNAEVNAHMVAINVALGFEIHQVWGEFEKHLEPAAVCLVTMPAG